MEWKERLGIVLKIEAVLLAVIVAGILTLSPEKAASFRLYELLGVLMAASITTLGLREMKDLT